MAFGIANTSELPPAERRNALTQSSTTTTIPDLAVAGGLSENVNTTFAEQGAVLFHERDPGQTVSMRHPEAGRQWSARAAMVCIRRACGESDYLPDRALEKGIAAVITPIETIRTDPRAWG